MKNCFLKSGFRFDLKNLTKVWIQRIHDPFFNFSKKKTQNPFLDSRIRILIFLKKMHPKFTTRAVRECNAAMYVTIL